MSSHKPMGSSFCLTDKLIRRQPFGLSLDLDPIASLPPLTTIGDGLHVVSNVLQLAETGVQPGVYSRVQVDSYGRVIDGVENSALSDQLLTTDSVIDGGTF